MSRTKIGFISLGCPKNLIDTEIMLKILLDNGYELVSEDIHADIIIINTCAFTKEAKQESIDAVIDTAWLKKNRSLRGIVVCGCLAERYRDEVLEELPEIDAVVGVFSLKNILEAVRHIDSGAAAKEKFKSFDSGENFKPGGERVLTTPEYTAYIKIAEGCDNMCSYCVIPAIRGRFVSREREDIINEARELAALGVCELNVVAQDTTRYGTDLYGGCALPELLDDLCGIEGIEWIRLLYCYPDKITDELIFTIKNQKKIVKYLDLPIQHINDDILKAMGRAGREAAVRSAVSRLRENIPGITLRTTVIAGFPGESREQFGELCEFIKETKFERLGAFAYSREENTPAAGFDGQINEEEKERRFKIIMNTQKKINREINKAKINKTIKVLCEGFDKISGVYYGRSESEAPEVDGRIFFENENAKKIKAGEFVNVKIIRVLDYDLYGVTKI
ncbi:MAG: 30S ribosomal protein S12 methylthiotransferase RimO [Oscillospiraceae bacterium]|nr:30S ribosomal protein S12 methylthiotransferase RimO [Oscillospiraceae bacterium]